MPTQDQLRAAPSNGNDSDGAAILNSWKDIANYLGRGVRTVQRWERYLGMPVHRPQGKDRSAVVAIRGELDAWLRATPVRENGNGVGNGEPEMEARLLATARALLKQANRLGLGGGTPPSGSRADRRRVEADGGGAGRARAVGEGRLKVHLPETDLLAAASDSSRPRKKS